MTAVQQEINNIRLEIILSEVTTKLAMSDGVVFEDIKQKKLEVKELIKKLNDLLEPDKIKAV